MIHFEPSTEPENFDARVRQRGAKWLEGHPEPNRPLDYWNEFKLDVRRAFHGLCAYAAVYVPPGGGEVDHYVDVKEDRASAYEWSNYRHALSVMNKAKSYRRADELQVLDPFLVEDDWFEIKLPSLELVITDCLPEHLREQAEFTLRRLRLADDEAMIELRQEWLQLYQESKLTLDGLTEMAPLLARAVEKALRESE